MANKTLRVSLVVFHDGGLKGQSGTEKVCHNACVRNMKALASVYSSSNPDVKITTVYRQQTSAFF